MNIYHHINLQEAIDGMKKIFAINWCLSFSKVAVAHVDDKRCVRITIFNESGSKIDTFLTRPANKLNKSYIVRDISFSPDSTKLAVAQSDNIIFVYLFGLDKKTICNKFEQTSQVTAMIWPSNYNNDLFFSVAEGKVKIGNLKNNLAQVLYSTESYVVSLDISKDYKFLLSGHFDNSIYKFNIENSQLEKIIQSSTVPYCLGYGLDIMVANNKKISFYSSTDYTKKTEYDYSDELGIKDFTCCKFNSTGDAIVLGNYNRFMVLYKKKDKWIEVFNYFIENLYSVTALAWKPDSSALIIGNLCGSIDIFESSIKKTIYKNKFEICFITESQIVVINLETKQRICLRMNITVEVDKISIQKDNFVIVATKQSLIIGNINLSNHCEIKWELSGNEIFDFSSDFNDPFFYIFHLDSVNIIEYSENGIIGNYKTSHLSRDLLNVKFSRQLHTMNIMSNNNNISKSKYDLKFFVYLIDSKTISIINLVTEKVIMIYNHSENISKLELNGKLNRLYFIDHQNNLFIIDISDIENSLESTKIKAKFLLENTKGFKIILTDILIAFNENNVYIWYCEEYLQTVTFKANNIILTKSQNEYLLEDLNESISSEPKAICKLDNELIEVFLLIDQGNLKKAVAIMDAKCTVNFNSNLKQALSSNVNKSFDYTANESKINFKREDYSTVWKLLVKKCILKKQFTLVITCYSHLGNFSKITFIESIITDMDKLGTCHGIVEAKIHLLSKNYFEAEKILLENNLLREAFILFNEIKKFDIAYDIARRYNFSDLKEIEKNYFETLSLNSNFEKLGSTLIKNNQIEEGVQILLNNKCYVKLANLFIKKRISLPNDIIESVIDFLTSNKIYNLLSQIYELIGNYSKSFEYNWIIRNFPKCKELLMKINNNSNLQEINDNTKEVANFLNGFYKNQNEELNKLKLKNKNINNLMNFVEEIWGDSVETEDTSIAVIHYVESKSYLKAADCYFKLKENLKLIEMLELYFVSDDFNDNQLNSYLIKFATKYLERKDYLRSEIFFTSAFEYKIVLNNYIVKDEPKYIFDYIKKLNNQNLFNKEIYENLNVKKQNLKVFNYVKTPEIEAMIKNVIIEHIDKDIYKSKDYNKKSLGKYISLLEVVDEIDYAINLLKDLKEFNLMIILVKKHREKYLKDTYFHIASLKLENLSSSIKNEDIDEICRFYELSNNIIKSAEVILLYTSNISIGMDKINGIKNISLQESILIIDVLCKVFNSKIIKYEELKCDTVDIHEFIIESYEINEIIKNLKSNGNYYILFVFLCEIKGFKKVTEELFLLKEDINNNKELFINNKSLIFNSLRMNQNSTDDNSNIKIFELLEYIVNNKIGDFYRENNNYKKAEELYFKTGNYREILNMYVDLEMFNEAISIARKYFNEEVVDNVKLQKGYSCIRKEKFDEAEKIFIEIKSEDKLFDVYIKKGFNNLAIAFCKNYCPEKLEIIKEKLKNKNSIIKEIENIPVKEINQPSKLDKNNDLKLKNNSNVDDLPNISNNDSFNLNFNSFYKSKYKMDTFRITKINKNKNDKSVLSLINKCCACYNESYFVDFIEYMLKIYDLKSYSKNPIISSTDSNSSLIVINEELTLTADMILKFSPIEIIDFIVKLIETTNFFNKKEIEYIVEELANRLLDNKDFIKAAYVFSIIKDDIYYEKVILCYLKGNMVKKAKLYIEKLDNDSLLDENIKFKLENIINESKYNPTNVNDLNKLIKQEKYLAVMNLIKNFEDKREVYISYFIKICSILFNKKNFFHLCEFILTVDLNESDLSLKISEIIKSLSYEILAEENLPELEMLKFLYTKFYELIKKIVQAENPDEIFEYETLNKVSHYQYFKYYLKDYISKGDRFKPLIEPYSKICLSMLRYGDIVKFDVAVYDCFISNKENKDFFRLKYIQLHNLIKNEEKHLEKLAFGKLNVVTDVNRFFLSKDPYLDDNSFSSMINENKSISNINEDRLNLEKIKCLKCKEENYISNEDCIKCNNKFNICGLSGFVNTDKSESCKICKSEFISHYIKVFWSIFNYCPVCLENIIN